MTTTQYQGPLPFKQNIQIYSFSYILPRFPVHVKLLNCPLLHFPIHLARSVVLIPLYVDRDTFFKTINLACHAAAATTVTATTATAAATTAATTATTTAATTTATTTTAAATTSSQIFTFRSVCPD